KAPPESCGRKALPRADSRKGRAKAGRRDGARVPRPRYFAQGVFRGNHGTTRRLRGRSPMLAYVTRRLWQTIPTLLGVVLLVFFLFTWFGGDPAYLLAGKISNPEQIENIRRQLGIDRPAYIQLWIFIQQIVTGDFGESWSTNEKVTAIFDTRLGPSLTVCVSLLVSDRWPRIAAD